MEKYEVTLIGVSPLLMHADNIKWSERVKKWQKDPANKSMSTPGDDRSPAWTWIGYCYFANKELVIDSDNLMAMLRDAGKKCPAAKGKGSLKTVTQSGILVDQIGWTVTTPKGIIHQKDVERLIDCNNFEEHEALAIDLGFELFVKRAKIRTNKHVRVRPRFDQWAAHGTITVLDETLNLETIQNLFNVAGRFVGLCDWRPGSPASGRFGMFSNEIRRIS